MSACATATVKQPAAEPAWELRFPALFTSRRSYAFPCDAHGHVDLDRLSESARRSYLYARAMMGRETGWPSVRRCARRG